MIQTIYIFNQMVEYIDSAKLTELLKGVSDNTRRSLLSQLSQEGPCRVTDLASNYEMSLNAISKHIKILEQCGLVIRKTIGRTHWIEADLRQVNIIVSWANELKSMWELRLNKLSKLIETETKND